MSWSDEYFALVNKKKKKEEDETFENSPYSAMGRLKANADTYHEAIKGGSALRKQHQAEEADKKRWEDAKKQVEAEANKKGLFDGLLQPLDDGWDQGDIASIILEGYDRVVNSDVSNWLGTSAMTGLASFNKSITSTADLLLGKPLQALGWEKNPVSSMAKHYSGEYDAWKANQAYYTEKLGGGAGLTFTGELVEGTVAALPMAIEAIMTGGTSLADDAAALTTKAAYATGNILQKAGLTVEQMAKNPQFWTSIARSLGSDYEEAIESGADDTTAALSSLFTSFINAGIEIGPSGASGLQGLLQNSGEKSAIRAWVQSAIEEGGEEVLQGFVNDAVAKVGYDHDREFDPRKSLKEFALGAGVGGILGGGNLAMNAASNALRSEANNQLTENEQAVVNKVYEDAVAEAEKNGKLTRSQKKKIYDEVLQQMEKGDISIDTIEEVLGGEHYSRVNDLVKESEEFTKLYNTASGQLSKAQMDRLTQLEERNKAKSYEDAIREAKENLSKEVSGISGRFVESYRQREYRSQAFQADVTQYDEKQRAVVQKAIDSGILNNTRRTHEFVDLVSKISADKGVLFDFTNNEKLKTSGFAVDGKQVNGFVTKDGITLNIDSPKAWQSTVGHEITHVLEGTEMYQELQNAIFEYTKDLDARRSALTEVYKGVDADIDAELTADLVGEYLFTDEDFVRNLSTQHRNVFQKIYDEIKYLYKVATAGSKEARELEKVKRAFEKAYREQGKSEGTKYSLDMVDAVQPKSDKWSRTHTTEEAMARFPNMWNVAAEESEVRNPTQITSTVNSYRKIYNFLQNEGFNGTILDASSGLGYGTRAGIEEYGFNVEDIEPYPDKGYQPKYQDYSTLDKKYDVIISNAVLNVLPQDQRDALAVKMGEMLNDGGRLFVNVRGKDVDSLAKTGKNIHLGNMEWIETVKGSYQKGFTKPELVAYLQDALGDGFTVKPTNMFGAVSAVVTKNGAKYSLSDSDGKQLTKEQQEYFKGSKVVDENGNLKVVYHGSPADFNTFSLEYLGTNGTAEGYGFYFTDKKSIAENYSRGREGQQSGESGRLFEVYLDIKKPLSDTEVTMSRAQFKKFLTTLNKQVDADGEPLDILSNYGDVAWEGLNNVLNYAMEIEYDGSDSDVNLVHSIINGCGNMETVLNVLRKTTGYDGIIVEDATWGGDQKIYLAFHPEQIKNVDNLNPTSDPDIRYSISEAQNEQGLDRKSEVSYSLSRDTEFADSAIALNTKLNHVSPEVMDAQKTMRERVAARLKEMAEKGVALPEDKEGDTFFSNSSYGGSEENTTICPRSLASEAFMNAVSEMVGRPLSTDEQIYVSQDLMNRIGSTEELRGQNLSLECVYCYVAMDRKAQRQFLGEYIKQRDAVLEKLDANVDTSGLFKDHQALAAHFKNKKGAKPNLSDIGKAYQEFLDGRKPTKSTYKRFKMWVDAYKNGAPMIDGSHLANMDKLMGDLNEFGDALKPQIADALDYAQKASWAKKRVGYMAYNGHILKWKQDRINKLNSHYGLRMYSFSDFHPAFVLENMQMITDASVRGLKMLGYTKDIDFVEIFAPSGMNINISTFGFEAGGKVYENSIMGAEWAKAQELRAKHPNVGVTYVATSDTQVRWAMEQDWIDVVIPYHMVKTGAEVAKYYGFHNYTGESADTKTKDWKKGNKGSIAPTEHNNDLETYLKALAENNLGPRFQRFMTNEDGTPNPNYMKLVNECRQSASDSKPVQPKFGEEAIQRTLAKLEAEGYYNPIGGSVDRMYEIAAEVADDLTRDMAPMRSLSEIGEKHTPNSLSALKLEVAPVKTEVKTANTEVKTEVKTPVETQETIAENATVAPVTEVTEMFPDDLSPIDSELDSLNSQKAELEEKLFELSDKEDFGDEFNSLSEQWAEVDGKIKALEAEAQQADAERLDSLQKSEVPPEVEAPYYRKDEMRVDDPMADRDWYEIGNRKVKAYMYEHPEVKPFFQEEAATMLWDLGDSIKAERWYNDQLHYDSGGEKGFGGNSRMTSDDIAELLDQWHMSYADIEKGLKAIIEDNGAENIAAAKKIEFMLNDRLLHGYKDFHTGERVPPNQAYKEMLYEKQINAYSKEAFDALIAEADQLAPVAKTATTTPPVKEQYEAIRPKKEKQPRMVLAEAKTSKGGQVKGQQALYKEAIRGESEKTAEIVYGGKQTQKQSGAWKWAREHIFSHGAIFEDMSLKTGNRELQARFDSIRRAESMAQNFIGKGQGNAKALVDVRNKVEKAGKTKAFNNFMYHMHNIDRMTLEERFPDTPNKAVFGDSITAEVSRKEASKLLKANPEFKRWARDVYAINRHLRNMLVNEGIISQETAELWETMYPHYVPISRVDQNGLNVNVPLDTNRTGVNAPIKRATGGNSDFYDLFDTMAGRAEQTYKAIAKNRFGVELKNTLGTTIETGKATVDEAIDSVEKHEELLQEGKNGQSPTFTVFENGERVKFEITEEMYEAMKPSRFTYQNKVLSTIGNARRDILTTYSPMFALTNPIKDAQDILLNSQHPVRTYATIPEAIKEVLTKGEYYQERMNHGGAQDSYFDSQKKTFNKEKSKAEAVVGFVPEKIRQVNEAIEQIPRMAEYIASRKMGRSVDVSMLDAARVTTNFGAPGDLTNMLNRNGFTFLGASVEGFNQQVRNVREAKAEGLKGWAKLAGKALAVGLPAMLLNHLRWDDDEEYQELSDYIKQNYYIVAKFDDGTFLRIPKGRAVAVIQDAFQQMDNLVTGNDEVDLGAFAQLVINNLAPNNPLDNNILAPIGQALTNKTWYGDDLVPVRLQDLPKNEQYDETTDSISRWLGELTDTSPYKWNYILDQYSGGIGDLVLPYLTPAADGGGLGAAFRDKFTTDSTMKNQNVSDFYTVKDKLTVNAKGSKATDEDVLMSKYMNAVSSQMSELYALKREVQSSDLSDARKAEKVRDIQEEIVALARDALNSYGNVTIRDGYATIGDMQYRLTDKGVWQKISDDQAEKQDDVIADLGISASDYWNNKSEYDFAYEYPEKYAVAKSVGGYESYKQYQSELYDIHADKDENGKSINGSRKEKVIDYVNSLDIDYGERIILFKSEYPADDTYNADIFEYINSRDDLSYEEKITIFKELGFNVDSEGYVTWD